MTVRKFIEANKEKYTEIVTSEIENLEDYMDMDVVSLIQTEMNGCEFYLWLVGTYETKWTTYEDMNEEEREDVRRKAREMDYEEADRFLVLRQIM